MSLLNIRLNSIRNKIMSFPEFMSTLKSLAKIWQEPKLFPDIPRSLECFVDCVEEKLKI